jgi:hypothetical protein
LLDTRIVVERCLHQTGFPIAKNLRAKVPVTDTMIIYDLNTDITQRFLDEHDGKGVEIANTPREVADGSVCALLFSFPVPFQ